MNNYSKQREIMLEVFKKLHHPTAEEIYNEGINLNNIESLDNKTLQGIKKKILQLKH